MIIRIGKNGMTEAVIEEIKLQLKKKNEVKVKFLKSYIDDKDRKAEAERLAEFADARLKELKGNVAIIVSLTQRASS
ncbi:MAG: YhbY family RNA-binding protein [Nanobdellota archaeon]